MKLSKMHLALGLAAALVCVAACRSPRTVSGTAVRVIVQLPQDWQVTQLRISGLVGSTPKFGPDYRPDIEGAVLAEPEQLVRVLLKDDLHGSHLAVTVEALSFGVVVASGQGGVDVERGVEQDLRVNLELVGG